MADKFKERAEVLGNLIKEARLHARRSVADCAQVLGVSEAVFERAERGEHYVSLPDLEALAIYFKVPMGYFWGSDTLDDLGKVDYNRLLALRNRVIGVSLRQYRLKARKSHRDLAAVIETDVKTVESYESGNVPIPYLHLEQLSKFLEKAVNDFVEDERGPLARHEAEQKLLKLYRRLPADMQGFLLNPVNSSYLETAKMLSEMDVAKLRLVAESLLDITF